MDELNKEQYRASRADNGVSLVLAGAGTGKTKTLVEKVRNVMDCPGMGPDHILVLTFSRRAAEELRDRIGSGCGGGRGIHAGTFHSFCFDLLRRHASAFTAAAGFSRFPAVVDDEGKKAMIGELIRRDLGRFLGMPAGVVYDLVTGHGSLEKWKRKKLDDSGLGAELTLLSTEYRLVKQKRNVIDYDDMMGCAIRLLETDGAVRAEVLDRCRYVFVDEFQDVSDDNMRLLKLLLPERDRNLFAVGDDWQSIYGFRGASVEHIIKMKRHFPETVVHRLTVNYRSRKEIVALACGFIRNNRHRTRKSLRASRGKGGIVRSYTVGSLEEEADIIRAVIAGHDPDRCLAVLFRNNWQGRYLKERLGGEEIPGVTFMTMHASKGLEFDRVVIAGVCDSILPDGDNDIEEERRLLFVACTRARDELHVIVHVNDEGEPSRFGRELGVVKKY
ncbi:MAG TPA: ATP-dependent helicase [Spirochaetota bacterium]|nr:ATP-dependent helicase [Spirochaetota bacterium]HPC41688.1 ATP-dependent helicase [Spirochaetota bacterium]HPL15662.1 ATP-dependent helicase [Spirochaetota bacterium]HQF09287.1 ATP-dependent helicase [Spirochaetota bacterium]HQH98235.1 ATP-dependent helicase [Spirochaetota bacterium]